jgi:8-oxo-dGTP pyrophosphatase MutT (NUDIX family)
MNREKIVNMIREYASENEAQRRFREPIIDFIINNDDCLGTGNPNGHLTASAWVVNHDRSKVLLTHHVGFDKWIQLGGHTDENEDILCAAFREAKEESGLSSLKLLSDGIFDMDVHFVPARNGKKEHYHYDIRFIFEGDDTEKVIVSEESKDVKWVELHRISEFSNEESVIRMARKTPGYKKN